MAKKKLIAKKVQTKHMSRRWAIMLKTWRKGQNLSQREASKLAGVDPSYWTMLETYWVIPALSTMMQIGRVMGVEDASLLQIYADVHKMSVKVLQMPNPNTSATQEAHCV